MSDKKEKLEAKKKLLPELITKALQKEYYDSKVTDISIEGFGSNGENFCSDVFRVRASIETSHGESFEEALVVKIMKEEVFEENGTKESYMYSSVLPRLENILKDLNFESPKLTPKLFGIEKLPTEVYIMKDMNAVGYRLGDRFQGLNLEETKVVLWKLAQFQAASMILNRKDPRVFEKLGRCFFKDGETDSIGYALTYGLMKHARSIVEEWEDYDEIARKMERIISNFNEKVKPLCDGTISKVNVISHGDLWVNNFLFNSRLDDVVLIDFQDCHVGSPAADLHHLLQTSVQLEVLQQHRYELLRHYYKSFKEVLQRANYEDIPSWQIIVEEIRNLEFLAYWAAVCELPFCCISKEAGEGFETSTFTDPVEMPKRTTIMFQNERVLKTLRFALDRFNELGVLD